jgi:TonB family protein
VNVSRNAPYCLALGALLIAASCTPLRTAASPEREALLSERATTLDRQCEVSPLPARLPAADVLVDSAALRRDVRSAKREQDRGYVLLSLAYDTTGLNIRRAVIEHSVRPMLADSVQRLVFQHRRELDEDEAIGVRLRIDVGEEVGMRVGRQELCPPVPLDPALETALVHFRSTGTRYRGGQRERTVWVRTYVNANGTVTASRVERGGVGGVDFERSIFDFVRRYSFRPATIDGMPVAGEILIPVRIRG